MRCRVTKVQLFTLPDFEVTHDIADNYYLAPFSLLRATRKGLARSVLHASNNLTLSDLNKATG